MTRNEFGRRDISGFRGIHLERSFKKSFCLWMGRIVGTDNFLDTGLHHDERNGRYKIFLYVSLYYAVARSHSTQKTSPENTQTPIGIQNFGFSKSRS